MTVIPEPSDPLRDLVADAIHAGRERNLSAPVVAEQVMALIRGPLSLPEPSRRLEPWPSNEPAATGWRAGIERRREAHRAARARREGA